MSGWCVKEFVGVAVVNNWLLISEEQREFGHRINNLLDSVGLYITPIIKENQHCGWEIVKEEKNVRKRNRI